MKKLLIIIILFIFQLLTMHVYSQNNIVAAGSTTSSNVSEVSVSIGLVAYEAYTTPGLSISQGNQQTYDITDGIVQIATDGYSVKVFPNPFAGDVYITVAGEKTEPVDVELYGPLGNLIKHETLSLDEYVLKTENLPPGSYSIIIRSKNFETRKYKLIKNK